MSSHEVIVLGAGISGLSFAHYCSKAGLKTLVMEKDERVGGTLHSHQFESGDGFWIEMGAHTCYNSYGNLIGIVEDCDMLNQLIQRQKVPFKMLIDNHIKSIPSQLNYLELLLSGPRIFTLKQTGQSIQAFYSKIVGNSNYKRVIGPAMSAVLSQKADDFPADMLFKKRPRRKDVMKSFTFAKGVGTIAETVALQKNIEIVAGKKAQEITFKSGAFRIVADGAVFETDKLVLATPASVAADLLRTSFPALAEILSRIKVEKIESVGTLISKDLVKIPPVAGLIPSSDNFYSVVARDTVVHDKYRGFTFHFKPDVLSPEAKLKHMAEVLGVEQSQLGPTVEKLNFIPSLRVNHGSLIRQIEQTISGSRLFLTGNYFDGVAIEDCVMRSLKEFTRLKAALR
ncbi:MAG: FAD-dependent oxidoreductase [Nitrospirae bacterium]|nr:FAD-dependent oxidoreductase [Nitrospirota bacterium]